MQRTPCRDFLKLVGFAIFICVSRVLPVTADEVKSPGEQLYRAKCASCHGAQGEGSTKHKRRLEGDKSISQLADVIAETMPEDDPGSLSAADAKTIAGYVHDAFYSPIARERNRPARIELSRLTVRQYRNALSDLVNSFRWTPKWGDERGLKAEYFRGRHLGGRESAAKRVDPQVKFDWDTAAPVPEITEPHEFSARWNGALLAPETGEYEFVIRTEHATRLWLNENRDPLIDAWVKSGKDTEYKASIYLIGGRIYPLRLEFTKGKQGVDDSKKQKEKPPSAKASMTLLWRRPNSIVEPVPSRALAPIDAPRSFVCATPFPPDDRSYGWERGSSVSKAWDQATTDAAIELAGYIAHNVYELAGTKDDAGDRNDKIKAFCRTFASRAFRRPLNDDEARVLDHQFEVTTDMDLAVKRVVLLTLKSPRFLYREYSSKVDPFHIAERLSFGLWDSIPDQELWNGAKDGWLAKPEAIAQQADRMLRDPRAKLKLQSFLLSWVKADGAHELEKDSQKFADFDPSVVADLRTSLELTLDEVAWSEGSDYRKFLLSDELYLNGRLAKFYGFELPADADFTKVKFEPEKRAGILTHPYLMATFAHTAETSPIHRGVFLVRGILGQTLRPPPEAVQPLPADLHPDLTTRERVVLQTNSANCMTCHSVINPLGFTLEHFDAVGRYRDNDRGKPIDSTGSYRCRDGRVAEVNGARPLAEFVAGSEEAHAAFAEQLFHHLVQQSVRAYGPNTLDQLRSKFEAQNCDIRRLMIDIMVASVPAERDIVVTNK
ncbi:MAG TPA: DUF1592 domain-containing protein [Planctomycetaceae bacterium]|nr:DUF1592 domain-containing protein [Planctomycetaceae bacterium]